MFINSIAQLYRVDKAVVDKLRQLAITDPMVKIGTRTTVHKVQAAPNEVVTEDIFCGEFFGDLHIALDGTGYFRADYRHIPDLPVSDTFVFDYDGAGWEFHQTTTINDFKISYKDNELVPFPMELDEAKTKADFDAGWAKAKILQNVTGGLEWENHMLAIANIAANFSQTGVYTSRIPLNLWDSNRALVQIKVPIVVDEHINRRNYNTVLEVLRGGNVVKTYNSSDLRQVRTVEADGSVSWNVLLPISTTPAANAYTFRFAFYGKGASYPSGSSLPNIQPGTITLSLGVAVQLPEQRASIVSPVMPSQAIYDALRAEFSNAATIPLFGDIVLAKQVDRPVPNPGVDMESEIEYRVNFRTQSTVNFMEVYSFLIEDYNKMITNPGEDLAAIRVTNEEGGPVYTVAMLKNMKVRDATHIYFAHLTKLDKPVLGAPIKLPERSAQGTFPSPPDKSVIFSPYTTQIHYTILDTQEHTANISIHAETEFMEAIYSELAIWVPEYDRFKWVSQEDYDVTINANSLFGEWKVQRSIYGLHAFGYALIPEAYRGILSQVPTDNPNTVLKLQAFFAGNLGAAHWERTFTAAQLIEALGSAFTDPSLEMRAYFPIPAAEVITDVTIRTFFDPDANAEQIQPVTVNTLITVQDVSPALIDPGFKVAVMDETEYAKATMFGDKPPFERYDARKDESDPTHKLIYRLTAVDAGTQSLMTTEYSQEFADWIAAKAAIDPKYKIFSIVSLEGEVDITAEMLPQVSIIGTGGRHIFLGAVQNNAPEDTFNLEATFDDVDLVNGTTVLSFIREITKVEATLKVSQVEPDLGELFTNLRAESNPVVNTMVDRTEVPVVAELAATDKHSYTISDVDRSYLGKKVVLPFAVLLSEAANQATASSDIIEWSVNGGPVTKQTLSDMNIRNAEGWRIGEFTLQPVLYDLDDVEGIKRDTYKFKYNPSVDNDRWYNPTEVEVAVTYTLSNPEQSIVEMDFWPDDELFNFLVPEAELGDYVPREEAPITIETIVDKEWHVIGGGRPSWNGKRYPWTYRFKKDVVDSSTADPDTMVTVIVHDLYEADGTTIYNTITENWTLGDLRRMPVHKGYYCTMAAISQWEDIVPMGHFDCRVVCNSDFDGSEGAFLPFVRTANLKTKPWNDPVTLDAELHIPDAALYKAVIAKTGQSESDYLVPERNLFINDPDNVTGGLLFLKDGEYEYTLPGMAMIRVKGDLDLAYKAGWEDVTLGSVKDFIINKDFLDNNFVVKDGQGKVTDVYIPFVAPVGLIMSDVIVNTNFRPNKAIFVTANDSDFTMGRTDMQTSNFTLITKPTMAQFDIAISANDKGRYIKPSDLTYSDGVFEGRDVTVVSGITTEMHGKTVPSFIGVPVQYWDHIASLPGNTVIGIVKETTYDSYGNMQKGQIEISAASVVSLNKDDDFGYIPLDRNVSADPISTAAGGVHWDITMDYDSTSPLFTPTTQQGGIQTVGKSDISCDGALNGTDWIDLEGDFGLEINGNVEYADPTDLTQIIQTLRDAGFEVEIDEERPTISCAGAVNGTGSIDANGGDFDIYIEGVKVGTHSISQVSELTELFADHGINFTTEAM